MVYDHYGRTASVALCARRGGRRAVRQWACGVRGAGNAHLSQKARGFCARLGCEPPRAPSLRAATTARAARDASVVPEKITKKERPPRHPSDFDKFSQFSL